MTSTVHTQLSRWLPLGTAIFFTLSFFFSFFFSLTVKLTNPGECRRSPATRPRRTEQQRVRTSATCLVWPCQADTSSSRTSIPSNPHGSSSAARLPWQLPSSLSYPVVFLCDSAQDKSRGQMIHPSASGVATNQHPPASDVVSRSTTGPQDGAPMM
ncbi:hypothetical protein BO78DRAFT_193051 [Aspergillus sclerotiicarbonarius CBS 121057]|uniref:Uncharacterized protein n=1 Tax=Aspergillus sclerotiicarbonarius (strain CBS 121057 / IBT 28362) TaxID=1448318 RepID=A0A319E0N7_ASPSB|nr:hypothetical protein BO78DRAFT_193051 [Aspergillus sclerotiicarbonarius CBS 121057]